MPCAFVCIFGMLAWLLHSPQSFLGRLAGSKISCMILTFLSCLQLYQHYPNDTATNTFPSLNDDSNSSPHTTTRCESDNGEDGIGTM